MLVLFPVPPPWLHAPCPCHPFSLWELWSLSLPGRVAFGCGLEPCGHCPEWTLPGGHPMAGEGLGPGGGDPDKRDAFSILQLLWHLALSSIMACPALIVHPSLVVCLSPSYFLSPHLSITHGSVLPSPVLNLWPHLAFCPSLCSTLPPFIPPLPVLPPGGLPHGRPPERPTGVRALAYLPWPQPGPFPDSSAPGPALQRSAPQLSYPQPSGPSVTRCKHQSPSP